MPFPNRCLGWYGIAIPWVSKYKLGNGFIKKKKKKKKKKKRETTKYTLVSSRMDAIVLKNMNLTKPNGHKTTINFCKFY